MNLTALVWVLIAVALLVLSFKRPIWAVGLYMQTFFAAPHLWWWGRDIPQGRYAYWAGIILVAAAALHALRSEDKGGRRITIVHKAAILMVLNATFVHFFLASRRDISLDTYIELLKYVVLFFSMWVSIQDRRDFRLALIILALGAGYIGYEVTINERGEFSGSRLEGVGAPGAETANSLANLMLITLPLAGSLFLNPTKLAKATSLVASPFILNVLLLCNSRGAFLGLLGAAASFLGVSRGATRKRALQTLALGGVALFLLLGDATITERFVSTFVGSEQRDNSASSRLDFWKGGLMMLRDFPLGDGGGSFKFVRGARYVSEVTGTDAADRSLHNGYLTEATDWGVQGFIFKILFIGGALTAAFKTVERARKDNRIEDSLIGISVIVTGAAFMIHCIFGSFLASEWAYWITALLVRYAELYSKGEEVQARGDTPVSVAA